MQIGFCVLMFILGAALGSFLCCQARRLRLKEQGRKSLGRRSVCLHCKTRLKWYDNLPIISWLLLRGKCRKCHHKIGLLEIISELGVAVAFALLATTINVCAASVLDWAVFGATLVLILSLSFLAIYDGMCGELPSLCLTISLICAIITIILKQWRLFSISGFTPALIYEPLLGALLLGGLYLLLYKVSKGAWVGNGDWLLALAIGLALGSMWYALLALFVANLSATIIMAPKALKKKNHKIYFGPFLVLAFVLVYAFGRYINLCV